MEATHSLSTDAIEEGFREVQDNICNFLENIAGQKFHEDKWSYHKGEGGGRTRIWTESGEVGLIEKGGVNFSGLKGSSMPASAATQFKIPENTPYRATGVSLVIHPVSPHIPTIHMNVRYFECGPKWWFGGGVDLTPYYVQRKSTQEQIVSFHRKLKTLCEKHGHSYDTFKSECDKYFFLPHRNEARGVGGIFFDHLTEDSTQKTKKELFEFVCGLGLLFTSLYEPFIQGGKGQPVSEEQREWQLFRRGRYVEFNLLYDRGTKFGLQSEGRTESILMSLPPLVRWHYNYGPKEGSAEALLLEVIKPQDWVHLDVATAFSMSLS